MGIGNTTTTAAVTCALLDLSLQEAVGRGAGLSDAGLARKRRAVERAWRSTSQTPAIQWIFSVRWVDLTLRP